MSAAKSLHYCDQCPAAELMGGVNCVPNRFNGCVVPALEIDHGIYTNGQEVGKAPQREYTRPISRIFWLRFFSFRPRICQIVVT